MSPELETLYVQILQRLTDVSEQVSDLKANMAKLCGEVEHYRKVGGIKDRERAECRQQFSERINDVERRNIDRIKEVEDRIDVIEDNILKLLTWGKAIATLWGIVTAISVAVTLYQSLS